MASVNTSFYLTYVALLTTGVITFIEALRARTPYVRHVMNLETCISMIAAYFYSQFVEKLKNIPEGQEPPWKDFAKIRYIDWLLSTPFMLLTLCLVLATENKKHVYFSTYLTVFLLNLSMLAFGYMGEIGKIDKMVGLVGGFVMFFLLCGFIWFSFMDSKSFVTLVIYFLFLVVWSLYGVAYLADDKTKNIMYNALDMIAKCFIGIFLWVYFTGILVF